MTQAQLEALLMKWQSILRLDHWNLRIRWDKECEPDEQTGELPEAQIKVSADYDQASVRIGPRYPEWTEREAAEILVHELLHVFENGTRQATLALAPVLSKDAYELHWWRYEHEAENWVDRLALIIVGLHEAKR